MGDSFHHRSSMKQSNKPFKGKARKDNTKGRVERVGVVAASKAESASADKFARQNHAKQMRQKKREDLIEKRRMGGHESNGIPPKVVVLVAFNESAEIIALRNQLIANCIDGDKVPDSVLNSPAPVTMTLPPGAGGGSAGARKQRVTFLLAPRELHGLLDCLKVSDVMLAVSKVTSKDHPAYDALGYKFLTAVRAQGMPAVTGVVQGTADVPAKHKSDARRLQTRYFNTEFGFDPKVLFVDTPDEIRNLVRAVAVLTPKPVHWRESRSYMLVHHSNYDAASSTLSLSGYMRGSALSANQLVHITGHGDFQMSQIDLAPDPFPLNTRGAVKSRAGSVAGDDMEMSAEATACALLSEPALLERADPAEQESLDFLAEVDPFAAEQTFISEEELKEADEMFKKKMKKVRRPKGWSEYQASWIPDEERDDGDEEEEGEEGEDEEVMDDGEKEAPVARAAPAAEEWHDDSDGEDGDQMDGEHGAGMTAEDMMADRAKIKAQLQERSQEDMEFPDEVDTPIDTPARERFQRYRGLKSFRTSPWDVKENLPHEYSRIFQFENFGRTYKRIVENSRDVGHALPGHYVTLHIKNVPPQLPASHPSYIPMIVSSLFQYENKVSVVHYSVQRCAEYDQPIKSKTLCEFHSGFRRFPAHPVFSEYGVGSDKFKYERFLQPGRLSVASIYGAVAFPPAPLLLFVQTPEGGFEFAAQGSLLSVDPDRLIIKKIVLTGYPFKVHKKKAVVRYMFFNPDDVRWFKPCELSTKLGLRGHIKEPLGTHGYMKCMFNGFVKHHDTVCLNLFKRAFPKWDPSTWENRYRSATSSSSSSASSSSALTAESLAAVAGAPFPSS